MDAAACHMRAEAASRSGFKSTPGALCVRLTVPTPLLLIMEVVEGAEGMSALAKVWELRKQMDLNLDPQPLDCPEDELFFALTGSEGDAHPCRAQTYSQYYLVGPVRASEPSHVCKPPLTRPCGYASLPDVPSELLHFAADTARTVASTYENWDWMVRSMGGELSVIQYRDIAAWIGDFYPRFGPPSTLHKHLFEQPSITALNSRIGPMVKQPWRCELVRWRSDDEEVAHYGIVATKRSYMRTEVLVSEVYACHEAATLRREAIKFLLEAYMINSCRREPEETACHP